MYFSLVHGKPYKQSRAGVFGLGLVRSAFSVVWLIGPDGTSAAELK
jgi:hypothetical protein